MIIPEGFGTNVNFAFEFFEYCHKNNISRLEERMELMRQMVKDKKAIYIPDARPIIKAAKKGNPNA